MTQESSAKKDTQRLQRAIVDGLEDVKAQDIQVFNTEHLSPLFERVIVASGTSNRQTKALAASVRDAVREAGFPKPRVEGEDNGEWIIVDCGAAVAHIMQPAIRNYYHLEEIWGDKPVRVKFGAPRPFNASPAPAAAKKVPAKTSLRRSSAARSAALHAERAEKPKAPAKKAAAKAPARPPAKSPAKKAAARPASKTAAKAPAKTAAKKTAAKKTTAKSPARKA
ncbi:ribosome silencing factor [Ramlibacter henchirensis]|uniref:Ribosomal silencing factor RsfS n=1 Tax=Ramlibacter henchirensis TaxID=204072 RepID=A0A4Z0BIJ5_9BURK|nr:ribosome silencing factor [Ramlibacter henchirensis]TFY99146.1 ribosome silencing factor [Ramlibacter henchirensis]